MIKELRDKRNKLLHDAQAILLKATVTAEELESARHMSAESDQLEERIAQAEALTAKIADDERSLPVPRPHPGAGDGQADASENRKAFSDFIRYGVRSNRLNGPFGSPEHRDITTEAGATGGAAFIPQEFYPVLTEAEKSWGQILTFLNNKETANGAPMKIAFSNDTGNLLNLDSEPSDMSEVEPSLSSLLLSTDPLKPDIIKITVEELQDSTFDLDAFVRNQFGKRYYRGLTNLVTNGSWIGSPAAAQNIEALLTAAYAGATSASATAIAWADITATYGALDPAYEADAVWSFNSKTRALLLAVTDSLGRPLYIPAPTAESFDMILGKRVVLNQYMPNVTNSAIPLLYGDFKQGYMLRQVKPGLAIIRLNERFMDTLEVGFLGYCRAGGVSTDAGTHPIVKLTQHS